MNNDKFNQLFNVDDNNQNNQNYEVIVVEDDVNEAAEQEDKILSDYNLTRKYMRKVLLTNDVLIGDLANNVKNMELNPMVYASYCNLINTQADIAKKLLEINKLKDNIDNNPHRKAKALVEDNKPKKSLKDHLKAIK